MGAPKAVGCSGLSLLWCLAELGTIREQILLMRAFLGRLGQSSVGVAYNAGLLGLRCGATLQARWSKILDTKKEVLAILDEVLSLNGRSAGFDLDTGLLGALPELDSMAVVGVINMLEERFGLVVDDDEIDGATFATVRTLVEFVDGKLG